MIFDCLIADVNIPILPKAFVTLGGHAVEQGRQLTSRTKVRLGGAVIRREAG